MLGSHRLDIIEDLQEYRVRQHNFTVISLDHGYCGMESAYVELYNLVLLQPKPNFNLLYPVGYFQCLEIDCRWLILVNMQIYY